MGLPRLHLFLASLSFGSSAITNHLVLLLTLTQWQALCDRHRWGIKDGKSNLDSTTQQLGDLGHISKSVCASFTSSVKWGHLSYSLGVKIKELINLSTQNNTWNKSSKAMLAFITQVEKQYALIGSLALLPSFPSFCPFFFFFSHSTFIVNLLHAGHYGRYML